MGKGIDLARATAPEHAAVLDDFKDQLLIVLIKALGGHVKIPVAQCDNTGQDILYMAVVDRVFEFEVRKKS
jgi:hypothetical protein